MLTTKFKISNDMTTDCTYGIYKVDEQNRRQEVLFAVVGDKIVHEWRCQGMSPTQYLWIRDCTVSPEYGGGKQIIDNRGCPVDPSQLVMSYLDYGKPPYHVVSGHHHVYKFADHPTLLFRCSIAICESANIRSHTTCVHGDGSSVTVPPNCNRRNRRQLENLRSKPSADTEIDVLSKPIEVIGLNYEDPSSNDRQNPALSSLILGRPVKPCFSQLGMVCVTDIVFSLMVSCLALLTLAILISTAIMILRRTHSNHKH